MQSHGRTERLTLFAQAIIVYRVAWLSGGHRQNKWTAATYRRPNPIAYPPGDAVNNAPLLSDVFCLRYFLYGKSLKTSWHLSQSLLIVLMQERNIYVYIYIEREGGGVGV